MAIKYLLHAAMPASWSDTLTLPQPSQPAKPVPVMLPGCALHAAPPLTPPHLLHEVCTAREAGAAMGQRSRRILAARQARV